MNAIRRTINTVLNKKVIETFSEKQGDFLTIT